MNIKNQLKIYNIFIAVFPLLFLCFFPLLIKLLNEGKIIAGFFICLMIIVMVSTAALIISLHITKTINKSIAFLQKSTETITEGHLEDQLERRKNSRGDNEITSLIKNLDKMRVSLREAQQRRQHFIMGISHDLRTPVAVIKGYTEALTDGIVTEKEEVAKYHEIILLKSAQLETMITTLINFVKLENNAVKQDIKLQPIYPVLSDFLTTSQATGTVFKRHVSGYIKMNKNIQIQFDKDLFQRVLENLFSNALRYTLDDDAIFIEIEEIDENIILKIIDTGIGIDKKDIQYIFDMLYRGTNSRREAGFGIGLSVVKNIIDLHDWKINVESEKGKGTTFTITIPVTDSKA